MPSEIDTLLRLVSDNPTHVLNYLTTHPSLSSSQDFSGYSLLHAATSYSQLDLLRTLVQTYHVDVNIRDSDGETPLFAAETVDAAKCLVEELGADVSIRNEEGVSASENARENMEDGSGWAEVAEYLETRMAGAAQAQGTGAADGGVSLSGESNGVHAPPPLPPNVKINVGTMQEPPLEGEDAPDPEFRRRIEELAAREDFQSEDGQRELRDLVAQVVGGMNADSNGREVRRRVE